MKRASFVSIVLMLCVSFAGCSGLNPVSVAQTPEQKADALYDTFLVYKQKAVDLAVMPGTPQSTINTLARADRVVTPIMNSLQDAAIEVEKVRAEVAAGNGTEQTLIIVTNNLERWLLEAIPALQALIDAVSSANSRASLSTQYGYQDTHWRYA